MPRSPKGRRPRPNEARALASQRQAWNRNAAAWTEHVAGGGGFRELLDPFVWRALGRVAGRSFLDAGCGEGRFCRRLADGGASRTVGIDLSSALVRAARAEERRRSLGRGRERRRVRPVYRVGDAGELPASERFDGIVAYLSLMHFPEPLRALRAWRGALTEKGVVAAVLPHPFTQAPGGAWQVAAPPVPGTEPPRVENFRIGAYFQTGWQEFCFPGRFPSPTRNYHRPLSAWARLFEQAGLTWTGLWEPRPSAASIRRHPEWAPLRTVPYFLVVRARAGGSPSRAIW